MYQTAWHYIPDNCSLRSSYVPKNMCRFLHWNRILRTFKKILCLGWGRRWHSWLRHCATSWKVAGSIPNGFIGIFHWHNPFSRTMTLGLTQSLTEMSTRNISLGGKGSRCVGLTTLPPSCADCLEILGASTSWYPQGLSRPVMGLVYLFTVSVEKISFTF
jgi:hypothetical protein